MATSNPTGKISREDFRRQKDLEEKRKAGTIPAEVDPETGQDINPHIPHYISKAPWYLDIQHPTLKHQRAPDKDEGTISSWYDRGARNGPAATKFRKGACENCGAMTHKTLDCLERPRKKGARWTGQDIQADEVVQDVHLGFEAKRDRWNGYDANDHTRVVEEWELIDQARRKVREDQLSAKQNEPVEEADKPAADDDDDDDDANEGDEDKYADAADAVGQKVDAKTRITVRNLRIREDTAKYLLNLDVNSAYYDPKTRAMRENPLQDSHTPDSVFFAGDNFVRYTGDAPKVAAMQAFAWEAADMRGKDVHMQALPTQGELLFKEYQSKKSTVADKQKDSILAKYGGEEHLQAPPKELLLAQTEQYVEYSQAGRLIKGQERATMKSKYEEDVLPLNHTAIWGSWWHDFKWGYACCHQTARQSYCTGRAGIDAASASEQLMLKDAPDKDVEEEDERAAAARSSASKSLLEQHKLKVLKEIIKDDKSKKDHEKSKKDDGKDKDDKKKDDKKRKARGERMGEGDIEIDPKKLKAAKEAALKRSKAGDDGYNAAKPDDTDVTEEDLEAYRLMRSRGDDPIANFIGQDAEDDE
ncbi:hypothetical protein SmJEL517_g02417 [Synchytrium microbalum]|uniref:Pre-mRNA-splicing factor SLU7 n=1 Tax=Synchytrium microbalum TaxID=1806994 RepID=A0A507C6K4_9FUNG|nr:uncharacterized protein SmJEL517_g02417 [Synchytrium microbalum]TPX35131.1 hypothetical protein SmJEL517_g02417 [Synchytrium microbalum]